MVTRADSNCRMGEAVARASWPISSARAPRMRNEGSGSVVFLLANMGEVSRQPISLARAPRTRIDRMVIRRTVLGACAQWEIG